ncbi:MAG: copper chaperone PCu(A)C [Pseudomonadota bacterium]
MTIPECRRFRAFPRPAGVSRSLRVLPGRAFISGTMLVALAGASFSASAQSLLTVDGAWVRAMPPTQKMTAAYATITNASEGPITLSGVESTIGDASLHETTVEDGQSRMRALPKLQLEPGESAELAPGGMHIMLMGLSRAPREGEAVELCLVLDDTQQCFKADVRRGAPDDSHHQHH